MRGKGIRRPSRFEKSNQFAKALELKTIAEGVEDAATADLLKSMGVDCLQGFHFGRPMPLTEFDAWLQARR